MLLYVASRQPKNFVGKPAKVHFQKLLMFSVARLTVSVLAQKRLQMTGFYRMWLHDNHDKSAAFANLPQKKTAKRFWKLLTNHVRKKIT